ncbi:MAG: hypothetical protein GX334_03715 [Firmicutes bacterium]|nr:hypothetical protein [Bacillota bacterium]
MLGLLPGKVQCRAGVAEGGYGAGIMGCWGGGLALGGSCLVLEQAKTFLHLDTSLIFC